MNAALVFHCCSVVSWGPVSDPCWCCGQASGQDAWADPTPNDDDAMLARKYTRLSDVVVKKALI